MEYGYVCCFRQYGPKHELDLTKFVLQATSEATAHAPNLSDDLESDWKF